MRPLIRLVLVEPSATLGAQLLAGMATAVEAFERTDLDLEVLLTPTVAEALAVITDDGDVQAVVLSRDVIYSDTGPLAGTGRSDFAAVIDAIRKIRIEVAVYVLGDHDDGLHVIHDSDEVEAFFVRDEVLQDPESIVGYILNDIDDRMETPFWTAYRKYIVESNDSWHTPGHSGGTSFRNSPYIRDFYQFYGRNVFAGDLSVSVDSLGSLGDSSSVIGRAQASAAYTFEVKRTYFITNGSSTANKMVLQTLLRRGDTVIVDRNCHKSVHYGIVQAASWPVYLDSQLNPTHNFFAPPSLDGIREAIAAHPDAKLLVLTGCSYEGLLIDLRQVVNLAHAHGIKVFIDEAWFAYSQFHPQFRHYSAINAGADYVTHSAHKVLSAFSQASFLHVNDPDFDADFFREVYNLYTSTSPKYQLIASLDISQKQMEMEGYKILHGLLAEVETLKEAVSKLERIAILGPSDFAEMFPHYRTDNVGHDPLKVLFDVSKLPYPTRELQRYLMDEVGIEVEKFTPSTFLVLLTIGSTRSKLIRLFNALRKLDAGRANLNGRSGKKRKKLPSSVPPIELVMLPADAFFSRREWLPLAEATGRVSAGLVSPYPPGIPLLVPGQRIGPAHLAYLTNISAPKVTIQGLVDGMVSVVESTIAEVAPTSVSRPPCGGRLPGAALGSGALEAASLLETEEP